MARTSIIRPSLSHPNRRLYNKLAYDLGDEAIVQLEECYKGVLIDLGCGTAPYRNYLSQFVDRYVGIDWSKSIHDIEADVIADLTLPLPIADGVADTVFCLSVLEHLSDPIVMLEEAHRILRSGGRMVLMVPFMWHVHEAPHDYFRFTRYGLKHLSEMAGFTEINVREVSGFWATWVLKFNYQTLKLIRGHRQCAWFARTVLAGIWWMDQAIARVLDRYWHAPGETQAYIVVASKP